MKHIKVESIRMDGGTQPRAELNHDTIAEYAEALAAKASFPPVIVFYDGTDYWLADGFHRTKAHVLAGKKTIDADVRQGSVRDAILFSVGANADHGMRRTNEDKRRAVMRLLNDDEWVKWSDRKIAQVCGVSHELVRKTRPICQPLTDTTTRKVERNGTVYTQNTANIGGSRSVVTVDVETGEVEDDAEWEVEDARSLQRKEPQKRLPKFNQAKNTAISLWFLRDDPAHNVEVLRKNFSDKWCESFAKQLLATIKEASNG